jgi:elongation factor G
MFNYATYLRSMTAGRGTYSMEPSTYEPCPESIATDVLKEAREAKEKKRKK